MQNPRDKVIITCAVTGNQTLKAIKVTAEEPSPEGEILRGVHEDQTVYTLKVQNNGINPTTGTKLDAFVPAGLEYLGCGAPGGSGTDHTHDAMSLPHGHADTTGVAAALPPGPATVIAERPKLV